MAEQNQERVFYVKGMHCASCEILIEQKLLELENVKAVDASTSRGQVVVEYLGQAPSLDKLNQIFKPDGYRFSDRPRETRSDAKETNGSWSILGLAGLVLLGFFLLDRLGLSRLVSVDSSSSLPSFFALGLLAGFSTCAALVGGLVLSLSKQWSDRSSAGQKFSPHLLFNLGRLISFFLLGALLGQIGGQLHFSLISSSLLAVVVSVVMLGLGLRLLGFTSLPGLSFSTPRFLTRVVSRPENFRSGFLPFLLGGATFFLPCGFTLTAQGLALLSGSALQGGLIMLAFGLGTLPVLLAIGLTSSHFLRRNGAEKFSQVAGVLVLFFALFNFNAQLNALGLPSLNDISFGRPSQTASSSDPGLAPLIQGKQVLNMEASASGYQPNYFRVRAGVPVKWVVQDTGTSGCTNAIVSRSLFDGQINLTQGETSVKEFTPAAPGRYKFSCWMGMISGVIEVVESQSNSGAVRLASKTDVVPSGARGCGCGRSGSLSCGAPR